MLYERAEFPVGQAVTDELTAGGDRRRACALVDQGDLAEVVAPRQLREPLVAERAATNPSLEAIERAYIMWVLGSEGGNKSRAAETLGIDPSTLYRKLTRFGVEA